jgi:phospholipid transport system substrate-binding protein
MKTKTTLYLLLAAVALVFGPRTAAAGEPTEEIRAAVNRGVEILSAARLDSQSGKADTINRLRKVVYPLFDFEEMAKRSLGPHWRRLDAQRQGEFVAVFTDLLEKTYARHIDLYDGQKVAYTGEVIDQDYAEVKTKLISKKGDNFSIDYKLLRAGGKWRIYDVIVEGISLVNNYRSQFNRVIAKSSLEELMRKMKDKTIS